MIPEGRMAKTEQIMLVVYRARGDAGSIAE
jgi:hypothetical protein